MTATSTRWVVAAGLVCVAWVIGLLLWGTPQTGFAPASPVFWWAGLLVVGAPVLVVGSVATGLTVGRRGWIRGLSGAVWLFGLLIVVYLTQFVHFGGFCMDAADACVISWPPRVASLLIALFVVVVAAASELVANWWRRRHGTANE